MLGLSKWKQKREEVYNDTHGWGHCSEKSGNSATLNCVLTRAARVKPERRLVIKINKIYI